MRLARLRSPSSTRAAGFAAAFLVAAWGTAALAAAPQDAPQGAQQDGSTPAATAPAAAPAPKPADTRGDIAISAQDLARAFELVGAPAPAQGMVIPESEVKLALVQSLGSQALESRKIDIFLRREIEARIAAGAAEEAFELTDAEVDRKVEEMLESVRKQYPTLDPAFVLETNYGVAKSNLHSATEQGELFQRVFLPEDPREWPDITREAVSKLGDAFVQQATAAYEKRVAEGADYDPNAPGNVLMRNILRQQVLKALEERSEIRHADQGLPAGVAMTVDGIAIPTEEVFQTIVERVSDDDVRRARLWVTKSRLMEAVLKAAGSWLSDEEFAAAWAEHEEPYAKSSFPLALIALQFKRFPSMAHYRRHFRIVESFRRHIEDEITDEALAAHLARASRLLGMEKVDAEVILLSAYDFPTGRWKPDGWATAERRAKEVVAALVESQGERWAELLDEYSDFWDAPTAQGPQQQTSPERNNKGRFGPKNRNTLVQALGESEFGMFVEGTSVADAIFFDVETGRVGGPWRGPFGYYIALVKSRTPASQVVQLEGDRKELVRQDYVTVRLNAFADELVRRVALDA